MDNYTLFVLDASLDTFIIPEVDYHTLQCMVNGKTEGIELPSHPLFLKEYWYCMLRFSSAYFEEKMDTKLVGDKLHIRCNLKNYENEIESFLDWISPFVEDATGYIQNEFEQDLDTKRIISFENNKIVITDIFSEELRDKVRKIYGGW